MKPNQRKLTDEEWTQIVSECARYKLRIPDEARSPIQHAIRFYPTSQVELRWVHSIANRKTDEARRIHKTLSTLINQIEEFLSEPSSFRHSPVGRSTFRSPDVIGYLRALRGMARFFENRAKNRRRGQEHNWPLMILIMQLAELLVIFTDQEFEGRSKKVLRYMGAVCRIADPSLSAANIGTQTRNTDDLFWKRIFGGIPAEGAHALRRRRKQKRPGVADKTTQMARKRRRT